MCVRRQQQRRLQLWGKPTAQRLHDSLCVCWRQLRSAGLHHGGECARGCSVCGGSALLPRNVLQRLAGRTPASAQTRRRARRRRPRTGVSHSSTCAPLASRRQQLTAEATTRGLSSPQALQSAGTSTDVWRAALSAPQASNVSKSAAARGRTCAVQDDRSATHAGRMRLTFCRTSSREPRAAATASMRASGGGSASKGAL